jgi:hypothetical protein
MVPATHLDAATHPNATHDTHDSHDSHDSYDTGILGIHRVHGVHGVHGTAGKHESHWPYGTHRADATDPELTRKRPAAPPTGSRL